MIQASLGRRWGCRGTRILCRDAVLSHYPSRIAVCVWLVDTGDQQPNILTLAWPSLYLSSAFLFSGYHGFFVAQPPLPQLAAVTSATVPIHRGDWGWVPQMLAPGLGGTHSHPFPPQDLRRLLLPHRRRPQPCRGPIIARCAGRTSSSPPPRC